MSRNHTHARAALALAVSALFVSFSSPSAQAQVTLADFNDGTFGRFDANAVATNNRIIESILADGTLTLTTQGPNANSPDNGFVPVLQYFVSREGPNPGVQELLNNDVLAFDRFNIPSSEDPVNGSNGNFINNFLVLLSDVPDGGGFNVIDGSAVFLDPAAPSSENRSYSFNYGAVPEAQSLLEAYNSGAGSFMLFFLIQQTNDGAKAKVRYDNIRLTGTVAPTNEWSGAAANSDWNTAGNWTTGDVPNTDTEIATLGSIPNTFTAINVNQDTTINRLNITSVSDT